MVTWAGGRRFAATLSFDFDAEELWIGENAANEHAPGVLSQGAYGPRVGIPLILRLLRRHGVRATFFVPGKDALRHPDAVRAILRDGHEIGHHGHSHVSPSRMTEQQERAELHDGLAALRGLGAEVTGYRSPSWDFSPHTLGLLREAGLSYSSNLHDHLLPYAHGGGEGAGGRDLIEVPVSWLLDDAPHFWFSNTSWAKTIRSPEEVLRAWLPEIDGIAELGGHAMLTFHPFLVGRPSRLRFLETVLEHLEQRGAWIATAREIADYAREHGPLELDALELDAGETL